MSTQSFIHLIADLVCIVVILKLIPEVSAVVLVTLYFFTKFLMFAIFGGNKCDS